MSVLHEVVKLVVEFLRENELKAFVGKTKDIVEWKCVPLLLLYCYNDTESKHM